MSRLNKIQDYLKRFQVMWMEEKIEACKRTPQPGLLEQTEKVLSKLKDEQGKGRGLNFRYLALFYLRSSLWTGTYRYQICAMDETLYLNPPLALESWVPEMIYNDRGALRNAVAKELKEKFVRLQSYEVEFAVRVVMEDYQKLAEVYWKQAVDRLLTMDTFQSLQKCSDWMILSGVYMDEAKVILQSTNGR